MEIKTDPLSRLSSLSCGWKMNYLLEILLKLSAVTDTRKWTIMTSCPSSLSAHFVNFRSFHPLVLNMAGIIPGEICDQFGVKFWGYSAPGRDGHRSRERDGVRNVMWCVTGADILSQLPHLSWIKPGRANKYFPRPPGHQIFRPQWMALSRSRPGK